MIEEYGRSPMKSTHIMPPEDNYNQAKYLSIFSQYSTGDGRQDFNRESMETVKAAYNQLFQLYPELRLFYEQMRYP